MGFFGSGRAEVGGVEAQQSRGYIELKRARRSRLVPRLTVAALGTLALGFGLVVLAEAQPKVSLLPSAPASQPFLPTWIEVAHPVEIFGLAAPELGKSVQAYEARRHRTGGGRQDTLVFGGLSGPGPYLRLVIYRVGAEPAPHVPFFVDLARRAAEAELAITHSAPPAELPTRFGGFEIADVTLTQRGETGTPCLGFRMAASAPDLRISGFVCGSPATPVSRVELRCFIDRIDLNSAGEDTALAAFFAASELNQTPACGGTRLTAMPTRASWLDPPPAVPPLKRQKSSR